MISKFVGRQFLVCTINVHAEHALTKLWELVQNKNCLWLVFSTFASLQNDFLKFLNFLYFLFVLKNSKNYSFYAQSEHVLTKFTFLAHTQFA